MGMKATMRMDLFKECNNAFVRTEKEIKVFGDLQEVEDYIAEKKHWAREKCLKAEVYAVDVEYVEE